MNTGARTALKGATGGSPKFMLDARQQIETLDAQVDALYELMPFGTYSTDSDGVVLSINDAALALIGHERNDIVGKVFPSACFSPKSIEKLAKLSATGDIDDCELSLYGGGGTIHHVLFSRRFVGGVVGVGRFHRFVITDTTESGPVPVCRSARAVDILCRHIAANGPPHLTSDQMAALTGLTSRALGYAFHRRFGCTPIEWQRNHFLNLAHWYLTEEEVTASIKAVARRCGFTSSTSFSQFYKKRFGRNPGKSEYIRTL